MSNLGAILSSSSVKAASIEAGGAPFGELTEGAVEYPRCLARTSRGLQRFRLRRVAEHLKTLLAIIASTLNWCLRLLRVLEDKFGDPKLDL